jgi:hypothetical protein
MQTDQDTRHLIAALILLWLRVLCSDFDRRVA